MRIREVLALIAPNQLSTFAWENYWENWMPVSKIALAKAYRKASQSLSDGNSSVVTRLIMLFRDGNYSVRRAAYQALAEIEPAHIHEFCLSLIGRETVPYITQPSANIRKRVAEAICWLPLNQEGDTTFDGFYNRLKFDPSLSVRESMERIRKERRYRHLGHLYFTRVMNHKDEPSDMMLQVWRYGHALISVGNDEIIEKLSSLFNETLRPHLRQWYLYLHKELVKRWEKSVSEWPEPESAWSSSIQTGEGLLQKLTGEKLNVGYIIWEKPLRHLSDTGKWGGVLWLNQDYIRSFSLLEQPQFHLILQDGRGGLALASAVANERITFTGQGKLGGA